jgi:hypothetical protein
MSDDMTGGCQCGQVRYRLTGDRPGIWACHCGECQKQSGSAFGLSLPTPAAQVETTGMMASWTRPTASGRQTTCFYCPDCGSRLYHVGSHRPDWLTIKPGTLDDTSWLAPSAHIWVSRKQSWVILDPAVPAHLTQPEDMMAWRASFTATAA